MILTVTLEAIKWSREKESEIENAIKSWIR